MNKSHISALMLWPYKTRSFIDLSHTSVLQDGKEAQDSVNNVSCLCDKASIKIHELQSLECFQEGEHTEVLGAWRAGRKHRNSGLLPYILPYVPIQLAVQMMSSIHCHILYNKPVIKNKCYPEFVNHSSKLSNLWRETWEPPTYSQ